MTEAIIAAARSHWALGNAPITLVGARENRVFRVEGPRGPSALRLHRPGYRSAQEIDAELQWMDMLADNGLAVPKPIPGIDGSCIQTFDGIIVSLLSWVDGTPLGKLPVSTDLYAELGRMLARMHTLTDAWTPPTGFSRPTWDLLGDQPTWGRFWENPALTSVQRRHFLQFRDRARQITESSGPLDFGLVHADLVPDNVLSDGRILHLIDFDDGGFGPRIFDLATVTYSSRARFASDTFANAAIAGYRTIRQLEWDALPLIEAVRACSYVGWNISRINETNGAARNQRFIASAENAISAIAAQR